MKIPQITIKYSKALESSTQVINEKDYYKAKARLEKLGYKVVWFRSAVFHQEHPPSTLLPLINRNEIYELHERLIKFNKEDLVAYYSNQEYIKKYKKAYNDYS